MALGEAARMPLQKYWKVQYCAVQVEIPMELWMKLVGWRRLV